MGELPPKDDNRRTIPVTCLIADHAARGFCNLRVTKADSEITLDPHVTGACVIVLDETAATALFDLLGVWLGVSWYLPAPRGASSYPQHSWEELEGRFLGLMANLDPKR